MAGRLNLNLVVLVVLLKCLFSTAQLRTDKFMIAYDENCVAGFEALTKVLVDYHGTQQKDNPKRRMTETDSEEDDDTWGHLSGLLAYESAVVQADRVRKDDVKQPASATTNLRSRQPTVNIPTQRDQIVATLKILGKLARNTQSVGRQLKDDDGIEMKADYLKELDVDVIEDIEDTQLYFKLSHLLPCLAMPPEQDAVVETQRYTTFIPNDMDISSCSDDKKPRHPWHLLGKYSSVCPEKYGAEVTEAWSLIRQYGRGKDVVVAVVDTGCSFHADLAPNYCLINSDCAGYDFGDDTNDPFLTPHSNHGTSVMSVLAARGNNGYGIAGVCWNCKVMCIKTYSTRAKGILLSAIIKSLDYLTNATKKGILKISNHSYAILQRSEMTHRALKRLTSVGHLPIFSAGNYSCDLDKLGPLAKRPQSCKTLKKAEFHFLAPANYYVPGVLVVGSHEQSGDLSSFTNYGKKSVHLFAPGTYIQAPVGKCTMDGSTSTVMVLGTSFAAPIVTGTAALLLYVDPTLTAQQLRGILMKSVREHPDFKELCASGGMLSALRAVQRVLPHSGPVQIRRNRGPTALEAIFICHNADSLKYAFK